MSTPGRYEIDLMRPRHGADYRVSQLATITGLSGEEIDERLPAELLAADSWPGRNFVKAARALGYNCNRQFKPFDARTYWPCILRVQTPTIKNGWWALIYANGAVYSPWDGWVKWLDDFVRDEPEARITSMLQIWIA